MYINTAARDANSAGTAAHLHALAEGQRPVEVHLVGVDEGVAEVSISFANFLQPNWATCQLGHDSMLTQSG